MIIYKYIFFEFLQMLILRVVKETKISKFCWRINNQTRSNVRLKMTIFLINIPYFNDKKRLLSNIGSLYLYWLWQEGNLLRLAIESNEHNNKIETSFKHFPLRQTTWSSTTRHHIHFKLIPTFSVISVEIIVFWLVESSFIQTSF